MPRNNDSSRGDLISLGLELAVGIGLGAAVGYWIDEKWHTAPWGILIGCIFGFSAGMYLLIKAAIKANKD
jgi:F0F1-type ATP synthase assembly protein I